jgi:hypothetical protein
MNDKLSYLHLRSKDEANNNDDNKNGGNKLRTYKKLKNSYKMEKFVHSDVDKLALSIFPMVNISVF